MGFWQGLKQYHQTCRDASQLGQEVGKQLHELGMDVNDIGFDSLCELAVENGIEYQETGVMEAVESGVEDGYDDAARQAATPLRRFFWGVF